MLKVIDRQRQLIGFDIKGFLDGYKYSTTVDTSGEKVNLSTNAIPSENGVAKEEKAGSDILLKVNINTADKMTLQQLPGIGPVLAGRIIEYREANGRFDTDKDLAEVKGIGKMKLAKIRGYIEF